MESKTQRFRCTFCQRGFTRSDTRRLHYDKCRARIAAGISVPPPARKGRKLRACDICAQRKRACNYEIPCGSCKAKNLRCHYSRAGNSTTDDNDGPPACSSVRNATAIDVEASEQQYPSMTSKDHLGEENSGVTFTSCVSAADSYRGAATWNDDQSFIPGDIPASSSFPSYPQSTLALSRALRPTIQRPEASPLTFLRNFASAGNLKSIYTFAFFKSRHKSFSRHPGTQYMGSTPTQFLIFSNFNTGYIPQYPQPIPPPRIRNASPLPISWQDSTTINPEGPLESYSFESFSDADTWVEYDNGRPDSLSHYPDISEFEEFICWMAHPLFVRTREIWLSIQDASLRISEEYPSMPIEQSRRCLHFFSPVNLERFTNYFFDDWYPHSPIIHRPTFDLLTAPTNLILVMCLMGAIVSPSPEDTLSAKEWFDYAEDLIFNHTSGLQQNVEYLRLGLSKPAILQAGFLMCCLQNWEGTEEARGRIRRHRYQILIDASRRIGHEKATHKGGVSWATDAFDWSQWVITEELIRIQLFIWLVDTSFVIFHNAPSKIQTSELRCDLLSPPTAFQASSSLACQNFLLQLTPPGSLRTCLDFSSAVNILRSNTFDQATSSAFFSLDSVNLFCLLAAIYVMPFHQQQQAGQLLFTKQSKQKLATIRSALSTWQLAWNVRSDILYMQELEMSDDVEPWIRCGFFQHAEEFRIYSLGALSVLEGKLGIRNSKSRVQGSGAAFGARFTAGPASAHEQTGLGSSAAPWAADGEIGGGDNVAGGHVMGEVKVLEKVDETSMDQVSSLLARLECQPLDE